MRADIIQAWTDTPY